MSEPLRALVAWFIRHCDGEWEHEAGIVIRTLDNPGWAVDVDLVGTNLEDQAFEAMTVTRGTLDWIVCRVESGKFLARCGPANLEEALGVFSSWSRREGGDD